VYQLRVLKVAEMLDIWYGLQQSAVDSAVDGERAVARLRTGQTPKENILSSDNRVIVRAVIGAVKQCSKFVEYVFQIG